MKNYKTPLKILRKMKDFKEFINNKNKWEEDEHNQIKYSSNTNLPSMQKLYLVFKRKTYMVSRTSLRIEGEEFF